MTLISLAAIASIGGSTRPADDTAARCRRLGAESLARIERAMRLPGTDLYAELATPDGRRLVKWFHFDPAPPVAPAKDDAKKSYTTAETPLRNVAAYNWSAGVQLSALAAAARVDASYKPRLVAFADGLQRYWFVDANGLGGFNAAPDADKPDRFYDDNAWMVLALAETYEVTGEPRFLERAEAALRFVLSGEDHRLGGGIYWSEAKKSKNACSNAPSAAAALVLYGVTRKPASLDAGRRLYAWTRRHLLDPNDGLYFDHVNLDGAVERFKWSYNAALMIRTACLIADHVPAERDARLEEARATAAAAVAKWVNADGAIADDAAFSHLLAEALLELYARDKDPRWPAAVDRALLHVATANADPSGWHPKWWGRTPAGPLGVVRLIDEAGAARAFWRASWPR